MGRGMEGTLEGWSPAGSHLASNSAGLNPGQLYSLVQFGNNVWKHFWLSQ